MKKPNLSIRSLAPAKFTRKTNKHRKNNDEIEIEETSALTIMAIEDLNVFIDHLEKLLTKNMAKRLGYLDWFNSLSNVLSNISSSIYKGNEAGSWSYSNNEELEDLEDILDNSPTIDLPEVKDDIAELIDNMIEFWVKEIRDRGYTIHGLLNGSEDFHTVKTSLERLKQINYPPVYGSG